MIHFKFGPATTRSHHKEATHGLALLTWQAHALPKPHHDRPLEEVTPLGLALMNPHSRLPSLAPLASQGLHTSPKGRPSLKRMPHQACSFDEQAF
ncbi:hypothetical protein TIFTF001_033188 [Ficus carica]|uniref:Uncharacterized protein n=1 Tax=Ficus carica TaxID=3494 RepID=A0AA88DYM4_FICCA|nr:hypothetical protein TIFTF001_033188 [Ficus carica]